MDWDRDSGSELGSGAELGSVWAWALETASGMEWARVSGKGSGWAEAWEWG
jgi:hypothetical protein